ncbi:beta-galactosidase GalA [Pelagicoccus sp. SDUM812003]|uniref:beta-galactosidase GalA n=1 Tax=Pelagicoccus sp. SDUM812003 TaxID=3041267 RepID=UPI00280D2CDC|nr:beta-galactosidase GalA [Pelagicoccus sp. SDUM812003]MDQ8201839.1 beta-galactosidase GalA [Pelagicoccus sp. SDUM812003]
MNSYRSLVGSLALLCFLFGQSSVFAERVRMQIDDGWRFALGHATDRDQDFGHAKGYFSYLAKTGYGDGPADPAFDDRAWRTLDLPHDWAVEMGFDASASYSHGFKTVGPGFPESSVGWYRREIDISQDDLGKRIRIEFGGIYRNAAVFVNGFFVGQEPSGFVSQSYDISEYLNYGGKNVVAVRADASMEEGWYYEGAGIYRHAYLLKTDPLHVARYGTYVTTELRGSKATVSVETTIENEYFDDKRFRVSQSILDASGKEVARAKSGKETLAAGETTTISDTLSLTKPRLWDLDTPHLYTLVTEVLDESGKLFDRYETTFGVREIRFDPDEGFFLNGRSVKLKGTNNHHDHAGIGAALPDAMQDFRILKLKEMGSNAYRVSHHHASPELLKACDRLGMLVIDETRLMGINEYHLEQLEHLILRGRNHPSVIVWSIGNEEWAIEGNILGARITQRMQDFAQRLDPTRPITAAISGGWGGISTAVEAMGVNYIRHGDVDKQHREYPKQIIIGTEETTTQQTRGIYVEDASLAHQPPKEDGSSGGNAELGWRFYAERDYTAGVFFWTGFDYRGEPTPYEWPAVLSQFGILDNCGFPKDGYFYLKAWWSDEPVLHIFPHWNWPGREGESIEVRAHSNYDEVELFVNGESQGRKKMPLNDHLAWEVTYEPGELKAVGYRDGEAVEETLRRTTGEPAALELVADRSTITADGKDLAVIEVRIIDERGDIVPVADNMAWFEVDGPGEIIGVGNGNPSSHEPDRFVPEASMISLGGWEAPAASVTDQPVVYETRFDRPDLAGNQSARLLISAIGQDQRAVLNGETLYEGASREQATVDLDLRGIGLLDTGNVLRLEAKPFREWSERENVASFPPAFIGVMTEPEQYRRKAFNGLAQVIVQSTGGQGEIVLKATGDDLAAGQIVISAE